MKLNLEQTKVDRSGDFQSSSFDIGDKRVIMTILRKKMYSDPIRAICQEILSNSRDANREAGRGDVPAVVILPNAFDDTIKFIDNGLGITPERMENIFINYGSSTKREDNIQTGGFGLGAKTPFAYRDTFTITTVTDDKDGKRRERTYVAYIDETQIGAMDLINTLEVSGGTPTGTTISVAIDRHDTNAFINNIRRTARFWKVKPEIRGHQGSFKWPEESVVLSGTYGKQSWQIVQGTNTYRDPDGINQSYAVIDGIPYRLNVSSIWPTGSPPNDEKDINRLLVTPIRLFFPVGDLTVTANREDIDYQPETVAEIKALSRKILADLQEKANKLVEDKDTLWKASCAWHSMQFNYRGLIVQPKWRKRAILTGGLSANQRRSRYYSNGTTSEKVKLRFYELNDLGDNVVYVLHGRSAKAQANLSEPSIVWIENDSDNIDRPNKRRIMTAVLENPGKPVALMSYRTPDAKDYLNKNWGWDTYGYRKLSSYAKAPAPAKSSKSRGPVTYHKVKKLVRSTRSVTWAPDSTRSVEDNKGGIYVIVKSGKCYTPNGEEISCNKLKRASTLLNKPIYGILYKWRAKIAPEWKELWGELDRVIDELEKSKDIPVYNDNFAMLERSVTATNDLGVELEEACVAEGLPPGTDFTTWIELCRRVKKGASDANRLEQLYVIKGAKPSKTAPSSRPRRHTKSYDAAINKAVKDNVAIKAKYPLLESLYVNHGTSSDKTKLKALAKDIIAYVVMKG